MLYRKAEIADSLDVARFISAAGGGLYEFLFDDLIPFVSAVEFLAIGVARVSEPVSYRNCYVAIDDTSGAMVGAANAFPAEQLRVTSFPLLPRDLEAHIRPMLNLQDWSSMFLNALAVDDHHRRNGVGSRLLDWALARARALNLPRLSLHVWADNVRAREYYRERGFIEVGTAEVAAHPRLPHRGGSILMSRPSTCIQMTRRAARGHAHGTGNTVARQACG
jgi:GNAT superfamily N-acetyltransferase